MKFARESTIIAAQNVKYIVASHLGNLKHNYTYHEEYHEEIH